MSILIYSIMMKNYFIYDACYNVIRINCLCDISSCYSNTNVIHNVVRGTAYAYVMPKYRPVSSFGVLVYLSAAVRPCLRIRLTARLFLIHMIT